MKDGLYGCQACPDLKEKKLVGPGKCVPIPPAERKKKKQKKEKKKRKAHV